LQWEKKKKIFKTGFFPDKKLKCFFFFFFFLFLYLLVFVPFVFSKERRKGATTRQPPRFLIHILESKIVDIDISKQLGPRLVGVETETRLIPLEV
jgi:hypothetical protein